MVVAAAGSCLVSPPPPGPRQHRIVRRVGLPDQPVDEPSHFRNRQRYQGLIPVRLSPLLPQLPALACCRTTDRQAWANIDSVMCRCQPSHFRTSYWSRPTPAFAGAGSVPWPPRNIPQWPTGFPPPAPVPPRAYQPGRSRRSKPTLQAGQCCAGPAASTPCPALFRGRISTKAQS